MKHALTLLALMLLCSSLSAQTGASNRNGGDGGESHGSTRSNNGGSDNPSTFKSDNGSGSANPYNSHNKTYSGKIYTEVGTAPSFPGGITELLDYLDNNTQYPDDNSENGTVYIQFVVETDGAITNQTVVSGMNKECNAEALRVIKEMPKWTPAKVEGKAVRCYQKIGVRFYQ